MFIEETEPVTEDVTENVEEQTTEEIVEEQVESEPEEAEKKYTEEELNQRVDELIGKKLARKEKKIRKEYENKYGRLVDVLKAGTGEENIDDITNSFSDFYERKGIKINNTGLSEDDMARLGNDDAEDIIEDGYEAIKEETDRLASIGHENMNPREKAMFMRLAKERQTIEDQKELASIGIGLKEIESDEFKEYNRKLNPELSLKERYEMFLSSKPKKQIEKIGSMKSGTASKIKDYYSPDEIERLTEDDLDNPQVWEAVRKSMTGRA